MSKQQRFDFAPSNDVQAMLWKWETEKMILTGLKKLVGSAPVLRLTVGEESRPVGTQHEALEGKALGTARQGGPCGKSVVWAEFIINILRAFFLLS